MRYITPLCVFGFPLKELTVMLASGYSLTCEDKVSCNNGTTHTWKFEFIAHQSAKGQIELACEVTLIKADESASLPVLARVLIYKFLGSQSRNFELHPANYSSERKEIKLNEKLRIDGIAVYGEDLALAKDFHSDFPQFCYLNYTVIVYYLDTTKYDLGNIMLKLLSPPLYDQKLAMQAVDSSLKLPQQGYQTQPFDASGQLVSAFQPISKVNLELFFDSADSLILQRPEFPWLEFVRAIQDSSVQIARHIEARIDAKVASGVPQSTTDQESSGQPKEFAFLGPLTCSNFGNHSGLHTPESYAEVKRFIEFRQWKPEPPDPATSWIWSPQCTRL